MNKQVFKKLTKKMVREAFDSEDGMDTLVDRIFSMTESNLQFENQIHEFMRQIDQLNKENRTLREENQQLQVTIDKLIPS